MDDAIRALARLALSERSLEEILQEVTAISATAVPGADATSITLIRDEHPVTAAHAGQLALEADELQYANGHGPCVDAGRTGMTLRVRDMRDEQRWPEYAREVSSRGVLSAVSTPLPLQGGVIGALNVYATRPDAFDDEALGIAQDIAGYVAVAVANAQVTVGAQELAAQMQEAMRSRAVIDMAKGILMAQHGCSSDEAFALLSQASQRANRKLRELAAAIVDSVSGKGEAEQDTA